MLSWDELYLVINGKRKLTKEERENLIERIDYAGEGSYNTEDLMKYSDIELAKACISAENDYALSQI